MDLKVYYQKIRETESALTDRFPVIVSCETQDGGQFGVCTEVSRPLAAKMLVEGTARQATAEESVAFRQAQAEARRAAAESEAARSIQVQVVSVDEVRRLAGVQDRD